MDSNQHSSLVTGNNKTKVMVSKLKGTGSHLAMENPKPQVPTPKDKVLTHNKAMASNKTKGSSKAKVMANNKVTGMVNSRVKVTGNKDSSSKIKVMDNSKARVTTNKKVMDREVKVQATAHNDQIQTLQDQTAREEDLSTGNDLKQTTKDRLAMTATRGETGLHPTGEEDVLGATAETLATGAEAMTAEVTEVTAEEAATWTGKGAVTTEGTTTGEVMTGSKEGMEAITVETETTTTAIVAIIRATGHNQQHRNPRQSSNLGRLVTQFSCQDCQKTFHRSKSATSSAKSASSRKTSARES